MMNMIMMSMFTMLAPLNINKMYVFPLTPSILMITTFYSLKSLYSPLMSTQSLNLIMMDSMSSPLISLTLWISSLMILASYKTFYNKTQPLTLTTLIMFLNTVIIMSFMMSNLLSFYIMFELTLIPTLLIILGWGYQPQRLQAGFYIMMYTITASMPLLINIMLIQSKNNSLSFLLTNWATPNMAHTMGYMWWMSMITAFMVKMPIFSVHLWLPKAHVEAPVAGSMILAALLLKLGSYGHLRISLMLMKFNTLTTPMISAISLWGAAITSMICLRQTDMKSLIAYSSVGHMGILMAGIMSNSVWGWNSALIMMIAHGLTSSGMFAIANSTYEMTKTRNMFLMKGMLSLFPFMSLMWFMLSISNMAAPPSINLMAEIILISSSVFISTTLAIPMFIMSFLTAAYSLLLYTSLQHGHPSLFSNPMNMMNQLNYLMFTLHILPIFMLILSPMMINTWI